ncbi:hypothetical protein LTR56_001150 [Elasticomyces elasticus]|nr:hypothetical protein LTR56_001150 [Elasticomyces elasticus]KAK3663550.1 hypothetical protein LTR22_005722 [Elasticomyces elasticus]KAK5769071.1 hypothetical protein LTS12_000785 [Elasticomyces elasticus]
MFHSKKPYSAITVQVDRLCSEQYEEDDVGGIIDLVEVVQIQNSGPTEAARALRKKLKYGGPHQQIRALVILDGLIQNAGARFQRAFADEPLLERLRLMAREEAVDPEVRKKCQVLFVQWANAYKATAGLEGIANLYKELPKSQRPAAARSKVLRDTEVHDSGDESPYESHRPAPAPPSGNRSRASSSAQVLTAAPSRPVTLTPTSSSFGSKLVKGKSKFSSSKGGFNLAREKDNMTNCIARASIASTNLLNGLQLVNRETQSVSDNQEVRNRFDTCKTLRRQILLYIQHVESDEWIGSLVNANDELVKALTAYEIMDRSIDDDSDSDVNVAAAQSAHRRNVSDDAQHQLEGLHIGGGPSPPSKPARPAPPPTIAMPPKPTFPAAQQDAGEDEDDPFGDGHAAATPARERAGMTWREHGSQSKAADDPRQVSLKEALSKDSMQLRFEDRIVAWQASSLHGSEDSPEGSGVTPSVLTPSTGRDGAASAVSAPLTRENLETVPGNSRGTSEASGDEGGICRHETSIAKSIGNFLGKWKYE